MARFPAPYLNTTNADDPIMERVPFTKTDIGANSEGKPKSVQDGTMTIKHTGGSLGKSE